MSERASKIFESFLSDNVPPMGIYETLYAFRDSFGSFMGTKGTHPWSQGFPLTTPLEMFDGPSLPDSVDVTWEDRFYPKAWGHPKLRELITEYYNSRYGSKITPDNVMIFAGGRPGIYTVMAFLKERVKINVRILSNGFVEENDLHTNFVSDETRSKTRIIFDTDLS